MRVVLATLTMLAAGIAVDTAQADPYRWCAEYSGRGGTNCYFMTLQQCQWQISGRGGFCRPNPFYDGVPVGGAPRAGKRTVYRD